MTGLDTLPAFMRPGVRYERPRFDPASLLPDMAVMVVERSARTWTKVIGKARVWLTVEEIGPRPNGGQPRRWKFRLDDQTDGSGLNSPARFQTRAQHEHSVAYSAAVLFLREQGIMLQLSSVWSGHEIELARLVWPGRKGEQA